MTDFNLIDYLPIALMFIVAMGFAASQLLVAQLVGPRKSTAVKLMPYECGKDPIGSARDRYSVKFYMVAVAFLLFDLEILFIIPFAVAFKRLLAIEQTSDVLYGTIAFVTMMFFLTTVVIGLIYEWKKGAFEWSDRARLEARGEAAKLRRIAAKKNIEALKAA
jgi:NADH-quinone oxidoreductase subunit A